MSAEAALTPSVSWAQRPKLVFVTINVSDVVDPDIKVNTDSQQYYSLEITDFIPIRLRRIRCISRALHLETRSCMR